MHDPIGCLSPAPTPRTSRGVGNSFFSADGVYERKNFMGAGMRINRLNVYAGPKAETVNNDSGATVILWPYTHRSLAAIWRARPLVVATRPAEPE